MVGLGEGISLIKFAKEFFPKDATDYQKEFIDVYFYLNERRGNILSIPVAIEI